MTRFGSHVSVPATPAAYIVSSWLLVASSRVIAVYRPLNINYGPFSDSMAQVGGLDSGIGMGDNEVS